MPITHATAATGVDSGDGKISKNAWNEAHTNPDIADVTGLTAALAAKADDADVTALDTRVDALEAGGGASWGNWTTLTFAGSTSSNLGRTSYLANETITSVATSRIELEVEVEKTVTTDYTVGCKVGTAGVYVAGQSDGNVVLSRYSGGSATVLSAMGANSAHDYDGIYSVKLVVNVQSSTVAWAYHLHNDVRNPTPTSSTVTTFSMIGTVEFFVEGTIKRARARVIS